MEATSAAAPVPVQRADTRLVVRKHHALVRLSHWANTILLAGLIATGLSIYWASPVFQHAADAKTGNSDYVADASIWLVANVPGLAGYPHPESWIYDHLGLGTFRLAQALRLHWLLAYLFMATGILYAVGLVAGGGYRALLPRRRDLADSLRMLRYYAGVVPARILRRPWPHPEVAGKYNALQRGAYFSMPILGVVAILSGWAMHKPVELSWLERLFVTYDGARIVHFLVMIAFAAFVLPHVVLVASDGWDTFRSMITGWSLRTGRETHDRR